MISNRDKALKALEEQREKYYKKYKERIDFQIETILGECEYSFVNIAGDMFAKLEGVDEFLLRDSVWIISQQLLTYFPSGEFDNSAPYIAS